jgi:anti-sigma factor RsiW
MHCSQAANVHAYHDGELAAVQVASIESHLNDCADCRELLADLRQMSQLVATAPLVDMPPFAMKRMQQAWWAAQDRGVLRIASWLTAAAAAVIFAAVMFSPSDRGDTNTNWQVAALTPPTEFVDEPQQNEVIDAAQWIANDLALAMR